MRTTPRTCSCTCSTTRRARRRGRQSPSSLFSRRPVSQFAFKGPFSLFLALTLTITACELDTVNVPRTAADVVVHGVLNPSAANQVILVERTLTGTTNINDSLNFDANDPIVSADGIPISNAIVEIIDSTGCVT